MKNDQLIYAVERAQMKLDRDLKAMGEESMWSIAHDALQSDIDMLGCVLEILKAPDGLELAHAIQRFRNEPALGNLHALRGTAGYSELCDAWEDFVDARPAARLAGRDCKAGSPGGVEALVPKGWFLLKAEHQHTRIIFTGDVHEPVPHIAGAWYVELQRLPNGGLLQNGRGPSLEQAIKNAAKLCAEVDKEYPQDG